MSLAADGQPDPAPAFKGLHHVAFLCRDAEETRQFYEDVLGFRLAAATILPAGGGLAAAYRAELGDDPTQPWPRELLTMFFEVAPDNYVTFFDVPETVAEEKFRVRDGVEEYHLAFEVADADAMAQMKRRLEAFGVSVSEAVDLQANLSIYFYDPNGLHLEITIRSEAHDTLYAMAGRAAPGALAEWMERTGPLRKERLAGAEELRREHDELQGRVIARITENVAARAAGCELG